jgi:hypothetical protein
MEVGAWDPSDEWKHSNAKQLVSWFSSAFAYSAIVPNIPHIVSASVLLTMRPKNLVYLCSIKHKSTEPEHIRMLIDNDRADFKYELLLPWLQRMEPEVDLLAGYEQYEKENWDGYGAKPITEATRTFASKLMKLLPTTLGTPDVAPAGDGSIALEWIPEHRTHKLDKLYLDIGPGEEWTAYWRLRDGTFDTIDNEGTNLATRAILQHLFHNLSK